ncbi:MAG: NADH:ubiquinone reductase (Na(+)-transporting) subunit D [Xanthomonadales bacterium]
MSIEHPLTTPLIQENPLALRVLGLCPALAITNSLTSALIMSAALTVVLVISNTIISLVRKLLPSSVRLIVQITIIASAVTVIDQFLKAFLPDAAARLSVYVALIITNCMVLGRAEACAMKENVRTSILDAIGNGAGFSMILVIVAFQRELIGKGSLMGYQVFEPISQGGWFPENALVTLAPSAFFIIGVLVWAIRSWKPEQRETADFEPLPLPRKEKR